MYAPKAGKKTGHLTWLASNWKTREAAAAQTITQSLSTWLLFGWDTQPGCPVTHQSVRAVVRQGTFFLPNDLHSNQIIRLFQCGHTCGSGLVQSVLIGHPSFWVYCKLEGAPDSKLKSKVLHFF